MRCRTKIIDKTGTETKVIERETVIRDKEHLRAQLLYKKITQEDKTKYKRSRDKKIDYNE